MGLGSSARHAGALRQQLGHDATRRPHAGVGQDHRVLLPRAFRHRAGYERRAAWFQHRERLMAMWGTNGRRPMAWWLFEAGEDLDYPGYDREQSTLYEAGLLSETERAALLARWRHEFDRARDPAFFVCLGPGQFLDGDAAREAHHVWSDIT